jgi:cell division protein FtsB
MAVLVVVFAVLVVSYASSMRAYLQQRTHISDLRSQIGSTQQDITLLEREKKRWKDDSYVEDLARQRFGWVLPGEVAYEVIGKDGKPLDSNDQLSRPGDVVRTTPTPWWSKEYDSLQKADHPAKQAPAPVGSITPSAE